MSYQCEEVAAYQVAELVNAPDPEPTEVVFEVRYQARGLVAMNHMVTRVRKDDGRYQPAKPGWTRDRMLKWLREHGYEMARNPVRGKGRTGTQVERHFWRKSSMGKAKLPIEEQGVRAYGR